MFRVIRAQKYTDRTFSCEIKARPIANEVMPGQHVILTVNPDSAQLPLPVVDFNRKKGTITVVADADDRAREQMQALEKGDEIFDCRGPFGQPSRIDALGKVICVGGGIGVAALFPHIREYKGKEAYVISILGFGSKDRIFWLDRISKLSDELYVSTEDGTYGIRGRATIALRAVFDNIADIDHVLAIGSLKLMRGCAEITRPNKIPTVVSLSAIMVEEMWRDGLIRVPGDAQQSLPLAERTEFDGHRLDFDSLIAQQKRYAEAKEKSI